MITTNDYRTDVKINFRQFVADRLKIGTGDARLVNIPDAVPYRFVVNKASGLTTIFEQGAGGMWNRLGDFTSVFQVTDAMVQFFKHLTHYNKQRFTVSSLTISGGRLSFTLNLLNDAGAPTGHVVSGRLNCMTGKYTFTSVTKAGSVAMQFQYQEGAGTSKQVHLQWLREFIEEFVMPATAAGLAMPNSVLVGQEKMAFEIENRLIVYRFGVEKPFVDISGKKSYATLDELLAGANLK
ncbi:MAG: hypothetical protein Q6370_020825 [Candidatus Sigynarchaeota archaeon]